MSTSITIESDAAASRGRASTVRWIVFDAVGTLIDPTPSVAAAYHAVGARFGSSLSVDEVGRRFRQAFRNSETSGFPDGSSLGELITSDAIEEARWRWIVGQVFSEIEQRENCFRDLWDHFARPESWRSFDDVPASLRRLQSAGYRLAIASNFDRRLHGVCDALPELKLITRRVVSAEVGYRKPAPEFYASLIRACGCAPCEILMIGDNYEHDVRGPQTAGLRALHLERRPVTGQSAQHPSLLELIDRLLADSISVTTEAVAGSPP